MTFKMLKKSYPKSMEKFTEYSKKYMGKDEEFYSYVFDVFHLPHLLYRFFDANGIFVWITPNPISSVAGDCQYYVTAYDIGKYIGMKHPKGKIHFKRIEAEKKAFAEAFKILETKLKKRTKNG